MWGLLGSLAGGLLNNLFAEDRQEDAQQFNTAEAAANRDWQERMSNTSNQRAVTDLKAAGLNPMLALSRGGASTPAGGQGSSGTASPGNNFDFPAAMQTSSQIKLIEAQAEAQEASAAKARAEEKEIEARTPTHAVSIDQMNQNIEESKNRIQKIIQETSTSAHSAANLAQQTINLQEIIPQIRATVDQLKAHTKLTGAQTTLAGETTALTKAQTTATAATEQMHRATTGEISQRVAANLPALEAALKGLERVQKDMQTPRLQQDESVSESFLGSLGATLRALNPLQGFIK